MNLFESSLNSPHSLSNGFCRTSDNRTSINLTPGGLKIMNFTVVSWEDN